jgi:hypothetical protein
VSELVGSMCMGVADLITDGIAFTRLQSGEILVANDYLAAYVALLSFGAVTTMVALAYRLHNAHHVRANLRKLGQHGRTASASEVRQKVQQHEFELAQTHRSNVILSLSLLTVVAQGAFSLRACISRRNISAAPAGLPMSGLNCYLVFVADVVDKRVRISLAVQT